MCCGIFLTTNGQQQRSKIPVQAPKNISSNLHRKYIHVQNETVSFDSLSIIPPTFSVAGVSDSSYTLDFINAKITWKQKPNADSVVITYRTFPFRFNSVVKRLNYDSIAGNFMVQPYTLTKNGQSADENFFNFGNITYNGSFGRSLTFGNNQDAVVTSNLNLQINGYLSDSIQISAALTDNNIPIQPDGTTAQLSEFDKIFLQFKKKNWALSMGDIDLRQNQQYFLSFYKRLQGASFETTNQLATNITNRSSVSAAIAKGKFNRNIFQGQEGNQGPYRLQGANNELYFVVLAGTEKVFVDGQMMQRGEDQDYIINYNTAEVTFTPKRMITQDSRIQVEFEYSNQNYLNVNLNFYNETQFGNKLKLKFGIYNDDDSRNSPINQTLDPDQIRFLNGIGDSVNKAFYPTAPLDTLGPGKVLYRKTDTVYQAANGLYYHDSVYVFSVDSTQKLYNLSFADVGVGNGDYLPNLNGINGNVYQWVAPVNGKHQGQFLAAQFLVTPKTQRIVSIGAEYNISKSTVFSIEGAGSHYDVNTLSTIGKANDNGYAIKMQLKNTHPFTSKNGLQLISTLGYEYVDARFQSIEPLRTVEFLRDWGLPLQLNTVSDNESLYTTGFQLIDKQKNSLKYIFENYDRGTDFTGVRNTLIQNQKIAGWNFNNQFSLTNSDGTYGKGYYLRPTIDISKQLTKLYNYTIGANYSIEHNEIHDKVSDTVSGTSFAFQTFKAFLRSPTKNGNHWGLSYETRENSYPHGNALVKGDKSRSFNLTADILRSKHHQFHFTATYRTLDVLDSLVNPQKSDKTLLGRAEYIVNEWKGLLMGSILYEVGSGQEQKQTYTYLQVPAGTGQYTWIDLNKDGIQQLNEFVLAQFQDQADYIKVFTPTNDYIKANYNTFNYSLSISPRSVISPFKNKGFKKILGAMNFQSSLQLNQKEQANGIVQLNPVNKLPLNDTSLITRSLVFTNTYSFNKANPKWGFDVNNSMSSGKSLLTYGYESKLLREWTFRPRINFSRSFAFNGIFKTGINQLFSSSSDIDSSDYNLQQYSIEPDFTYVRKSTFRITTGYKYYSKINAAAYGGQVYSSNSINTEIKYNILQSTSIDAKFTYTGIQYSGNPTSTISYVILDGLLPGKNFLWSIDFTKKIGGNLELNLQYEGRKPGEGQTINTGRASLRAIL
ncbi:MAG TPA: hypothetical protein VKR53_03595 [Puia sp.]|nr:hypothetical protein [Puia sp.]